MSILLLTSYLASCSSPQTSSKSKKSKQQVSQKSTEQSSDISAEQYVLKAQGASPINATEFLIQASSQYLREDNPLKSIWLSEQLLTGELSKNQQYQLNFNAAKASLALDELERAKNHLTLCDDLTANNTPTHSLEYYQVSHLVEEKREQDVLALNAFLHAFSLNTASIPEDINYIWQKISHLSLWQQNQLANLKAPLVSGWVTLTQLTNKHGGSGIFQEKLSEWTNKYPNHPANVIISNLVNPNEITTPPIKVISVIIPMTGKQAIAGKTVQEGMLAAYSTSKDITLNFIDSTDLDFTSLPETLLQLETEYVIGPLLKSNVEAYLAQPKLNLPTLFLNIPNNLVLSENQIALSMRPEDEALQAAALLSQKQFKQPIVFSHQDSTSLRIANAFVQKWADLTGEKPTIVKFEQGKKMQSVLKETLAVDKSQARIKALEYRLRETLKTESRNRRDIDMIYIVGNPLQTRLLKPYIDVNISPFSSLIPVFASSRSHSLNIDQSTINDLKGLTFTQIPWLLNSQQQNKKLAATSKALWPKRSDSLQQIFAMGFDSLHLVNKLDKMKAQHFIRYYGQTGILKLGKDNILTRSLLWGAYQKNKVAEIAME